MKFDASTIEAYEIRGELLTDLGPVVENLLRELLRAEGMRAHTITHRVKKKPSLKRKIDEKGDDYASLEDIHDLLGARVITYFPDEVDAVARVVEREFDIDRDNSVDKRTLLDPDRFGYLSLHYVCRLTPSRAGLAEHRRFDGSVFEIQIRSILQHAWAEIEHDRGYHTEEAVPRAIRRRFSRVAGLLELADAEFEAVRDEVAEYQRDLREESLDNVTIDRDSLFAFISASKLVDGIDESISQRYELGRRSPTQSYAAYLAPHLQGAGLSTISELEQALANRKQVLLGFMTAFFDEAPPRAEDLPAGLCLFHLSYVLRAERGGKRGVHRFLNKQQLGSEETRSAAATRITTAFRRATAERSGNNSKTTQPRAKKQRP